MKGTDLRPTLNVVSVARARAIPAVQRKKTLVTGKRDVIS